MKIVVDLDIEAIPIVYANFKGVTKQVVNNWIARGKLRVRKIDELKITLIQIPPEEQEKFKEWKKAFRK